MVERVGAQIPPWLETDADVGLADAPAVLHVRLVELRVAETQQVGALEEQQPVAHLGVGEQRPSRLEGEQVLVEGRDQPVCLGLEDGPQIPEPRDVLLVQRQKIEPHLQVARHPEMMDA